MIKCAPEAAAGYALRGIVYYRQHAWDNAIADFTKSLAITEDAGVHANLDNATKYKAGIEKQARASEEDGAAVCCAQEEYKRRIQKDHEDYCKMNPYAADCKDQKPPPKGGR